MENYINQDYFSRLEELMTLSVGDIQSGKVSNISAIFLLLDALPLNIDLNEEDIEKYALSMRTNEPYRSFQDRFVRNAIKNKQLMTREIAVDNSNINNLSAYYFLNNSNTNELEKSKGIVCKGLDYKGEAFYDNCTLTDLPIQTWEPIRESIPPVNAMLIIDKYIFSKPLKIKIQSLIDFVTLYKANLEIPFHLSILFSSENHGKSHVTQAQIDEVFQTISSIRNLEVTLYLDNSIPVDDRLVYTNYTTGSIGHPFDVRPTRFSQNFLGRENSSANIIRNYTNYRKDILFWNSFISKIPRSMGQVKTKWESSDFTNRLFEPFL